MSMTMLTILQLIEIFAVYTVMTVLLPAVIFYKKVSGEKLSVRFMIYLTIGNFYLINLVFFLQLLHISNRFTLWIFTMIPAIMVGVIINHVPIKEILNKEFGYLNKISGGQIGGRTFLRGVFKWGKKKWKALFSWIWERMHFHIVEWILLIGLISFLIWIYGSNSLYTYGYTLSDVPVHNYWINAMGENKIFVAGVYPYGFHCVIYYLHTFFGIDTYVLLRVFWLVQTIYVHLVLFAFIKSCCKTQFAAYVGVGIYSIIQIFHADCTSRFYSTLPQEFGMIFILPSIYFALAFFSHRKHEIGAEWIVSKAKRRRIKKEKKIYSHSLPYKLRMQNYVKGISKSSWFLIAYAMCFSMTISIHFYNAMIAGLFCVAIALSFGTRFFNRRYFARVIGAFVFGIVIAILPMGIAYSLGTPLQGSLNWGMNIIKGEEEQTKNEEELPLTNDDLNTGEVISTEGRTPLEIGKTENDQYVDRVITLDDLVNRVTHAIAEKLIYYGKQVYSSINDTTTTYMVENRYKNFLKISILVCVWVFVFALFSMMQKRVDYASTLIASIVYIGFLFFLLGMGKMGLPELMDYNRSRIFVSYSMPILWSFMIDAPVYVIFGGFKKKWVMYAASLICCSILATYIFNNTSIRKPARINGLESNAAVICLTNIIRDNADDTWTIVSASDELNMASDHGFHYETIDFLKTMEYVGSLGTITIPTHYVYFFIEKIPIDYMVSYENSGQSISKTGALKSLPAGGNLTIYQGENRWVVMSRMYYWAKVYQKMYSNEMKVYYEDDTFICYVMKQNDYSLNNFAIDYGYNLPNETVD
ncbi:MAG: amino acid ABC transporter permease [Velocimicrobium sp.]